MHAGSNGQGRPGALSSAGRVPEPASSPVAPLAPGAALAHPSDGGAMPASVAVTPLASLEMPARRRHAAIQILVVEDNAAAARLLGRVLRRAGYSVKTVGCYKDALRTASEWLPDLLVCDIGLPGRDGLELMRTMRRAHPTLKGIVVSGHATQKDRIASKEAGFAEHLAKPVSVPRLKETIRRVLGEP